MGCGGSAGGIWAQPISYITVEPPNKGQVGSYIHLPWPMCTIRRLSLGGGGGGGGGSETHGLREASLTAAWTGGARFSRDVAVIQLELGERAKQARPIQLLFRSKAC